MKIETIAYKHCNKAAFLKPCRNFTALINCRGPTVNKSIFMLEIAPPKGVVLLMKFILLTAFASALLGRPSLAFGAGFLCSQLLSSRVVVENFELKTSDQASSPFGFYLDILSQSLVDPQIGWNDPTQLMRKKFPATPYPQELKELEDDITKMYTETPTAARNWDNFQQRHKLSANQMWDVRVFYGLNYFDNPEFIGERGELIAYAQTRTLNMFLAAKKHPAAQHYEYYASSVGKLSVPEMAKELRISEGQVYKEMAMCHISIPQAFTPEQLADETQAAAFLRHHLGVENRGIEWTTVEDQWLIMRFEQGWNYQQIADELNDLSGNLSPNNPLIRTQQSISCRAEHLQLTRTNRLSENAIVIEPYGLVKASGALVPMAAIEYILDHQNEPLWQIADALGVQKASLIAFIQRQHMKALIKIVPDAARDQDIENKRVMRNLIAAIAENDSFPSDNSVNGTNPLKEALGFPQARFFGTGNYRQGKRERNAALNPSRLAALTATLEFLNTDPTLDLNAEQKASVANVLQDEISSIEFDQLPEPEQNKRVMRNLIAAIANSGSIPSCCFSNGINALKEALGIDPNRFFGTNSYRKKEDAQKNTAAALNPSRLAALKATLALLNTDPILNLSAEQRASVASVLQDAISSIEFDQLPEPEQNKRVMRNLIAAIANSGSFPSSKTINGTNPLKEALGNNMTRFLGITSYGKGKPLENRAWNPSRLAALKATLKFLNTDLTLDLSAEQRVSVATILQDEISSIEFGQLPEPEQNKRVMRNLIAAIAKNHVFPSRSIVNGTSALKEALGIDPNKFLGTSLYGKGKSLEGSALNPSRLVALKATLELLNTDPTLDLSAEQRGFVANVLKDEITKFSIFGE